MNLIVLRGIPGTGKSTLAEALGQHLGVPVFALDWVLGVLEPLGVLTRKNIVPIGMGMLTMLAERQLRLGQAAILDSPAHTAAMVAQWQASATRYGAAFVVVETVCSDARLHRERVDGRTRGIPGWHEVTWEHVERMRARFEPWPGAVLTINAVEPLADNIAVVLAHLDDAA